jgi:hypothetical protein
MKNINIRFFGIVIYCLILAVVFAYIAYGATQNYSDRHLSPFKTVSAGDAEDFRHWIDWENESGLEIKLRRISNDNWLFVDLSSDDTYQVMFLSGGDKVGGIVINSGPWATMQNSAGDKPILHLIPAYIVKEGFTSVEICPISGDGEYSVSNFRLESRNEKPRGYEATYNIIDFEIKQLEINIKDEDFEKIQQKRDEALKKGILLTEDIDVVSAKVTAEGDTYNTEVRLKGDWTDHLNTDKWAFRIELKGDYCIYGMQKFSIQPPETRNYIYEYLIYEYYREQGGVALRYDFADVYINDEYKGVYAVEEFMEKRVVENSQKREGPIIKLDEDVFAWERSAKYLPNLSAGSSGSADFNDFLIFSEKKTMASDALTGCAQYGIDLMNRAFSGKITIEEVFDVTLYSKLIVILDIFKAQHGRALHNTRHYYNPVTSKLEPIPFDEFAFTSALYSYLPVNRSGVTTALFKNEYFRKLYKENAQELLTGFPSFMAAQQEKIHRFELTLNREGSDIHVDIVTLDHNIGEIDAFLYSERIEPSASIMKNEAGEYSLKVSNNDSAPIIITGLTDASGNVVSISGAAFPAVMNPPGNDTSVMEFTFDTESPYSASDLRLSYQYYFEDGDYDVPVTEDDSRKAGDVNGSD